MKKRWPVGAEIIDDGLGDGEGVDTVLGVAVIVLERRGFWERHEIMALTEISGGQSGLTQGAQASAAQVSLVPSGKSPFG